MRVAIHQPNFLPWLGYFYKIRHADLFVLLDDVQYNKRDFIQRNYIKTPVGKKWIGVPVLNKGRTGQNICEVEIDPAESQLNRIRGTLRQHYSRAPHFQQMMALLTDVIDQGLPRLVDLNERLLTAVCRQLNIHTPFVRSSSLPGVQGESTERLISICQAVGADQYLSGQGGKKYQEEERYAQEGIELLYTDFSSAEYPQLHGPFEPNLSVFDVLANVGAVGRELIDACPSPQQAVRLRQAA